MSKQESVRHSVAEVLRNGGTEYRRNGRNRPGELSSALATISIVAACDVCGGRKQPGRFTVCTRNAECLAEYRRRYQEERRTRPPADPAGTRRRNPDAVSWLGYAERAELFVTQGGYCPWCWQPLPETLRRLHLDHIIPRSRGGPDEDWNRQLLHASCNREKRDKITPRALELAAEHGIRLVGVGAA